MDRNNHSGGVSARSSVDGIARAIIKQRSLKRILPFMVAMSLVISTFAPTAAFAKKDEGSGHIYTSDENCATQDKNHYVTGEVVWLHGEDFAPGSNYVWWIKEAGGQGATIDQGNVPPVGEDGIFCFAAHTIGPDEFGEYRANVGDGFDDHNPKHDNYQVEQIQEETWTISGYKFEDFNGDGIKNGDDHDLSDWTIYLDSNGNDAWDQGEPSTTTGQDGSYSFPGLSDGEYTVREVLQGGWEQTYPESSEWLVIVDGADVPGQNFGNREIPTWSISGTKFEDLDGDGQQGEQEGGLPGWTIYIDENGNDAYDQGEPVAETDQSGDYTIEGVVDGEYTLREVLKEGWQQTYPGEQDNGEQAVTVDGENVALVDFGNQQTPVQEEAATIVANKIVCDSEADLPNWGEGGPNINADTAPSWVAQHPGCHFVRGWNFQWGPQDAYDPGDTLIGPADEPWVTFGPTDGNGEVTATLTAEDIANNEYLWFREELQEGYIPFTFDSNNDTNVDNVSAEMYCHTDVLNYDNRDRIDGIGLGQTYYCVAFNVLAQQQIPAYTISGMKFNDLDGDGTKDEGEPGLMGWTITLNGTGETQHHETTTTLEDGSYSFTDLTEGQYVASEVQQEGWQQTHPESNENPVTLPTDNLDGNSIGNDFGNHAREGSITGIKFNDHNGNGVKDGSDDQPLTGWTIFIDTNDNGLLDEGESSKVTGEDGSYSFSDLAAGAHIIREVGQGGWTQTWPTDFSAYRLTIGNDQGSEWDWTGIDFGNKQGEVTGQQGGGGGGGGGGYYTPPATNNEEVGGEQQTNPTLALNEPNEAVGGEQLPAAGPHAWVALAIALLMSVVLTAATYRIKRSQFEE